MSLEQVVWVQFVKLNWKNKQSSKNFQIRKNPKSYKNSNVLVHELLKCKTWCDV